MEEKAKIENEFAEKLETRIQAVTVVQDKLEREVKARASDKMAHGAEIAKMMAVRLKQQEENEKEVAALRQLIANRDEEIGELKGRLAEEEAKVAKGWRS